MDPDRISLFHYAHLPQMLPHQKRIPDASLPDPWTNLQMFCEAITTFQESGYVFLGLDHFAKKEDELTKAKKAGTMYRNFQGHTTKAGCDLIGFGATAISQVDGSFTQNTKKLIEYERSIDANHLATKKGLVLTSDDKIRQWVINEIFCHQIVSKKKCAELFNLSFDDYFSAEKAGIDALENDRLLENRQEALRLTPLGRFFLRNIAMVFDAYLKSGKQKTFSKTL